MRRYRRSPFRIGALDDGPRETHTAHGQMKRFALLIPLFLAVGTLAVIGALSVSAHYQVPQRVSAALGGGR